MSPAEVVAGVQDAEALALATRIVNLLGAFMLLTALAILLVRRLQHAIVASALQSLALSVVGFILAYAADVPHLWVIAGITLVLKGVLLPKALIFIINRLKIHPYTETIPWVPSPPVLATLLVLLAFWVTEPLAGLKQAVTGDALPYGIALTLLGVLVMMSRKKAVNQMVGLYTCENGIFFTGMTVSHGMPLLVEMGVVLDVALGVLVMAIVLFRMRSTIDVVDVDDLHHLRG